MPLVMPSLLRGRQKKSYYAWDVQEINNLAIVLYQKLNGKSIRKKPLARLSSSLGAAGQNQPCPTHQTASDRQTTAPVSGWRKKDKKTRTPCGVRVF